MSNDYRITGEVLGEGAHGTVYSAVDGRGRELAAKCLTSSSSGLSGLLEASLMTTIEHPYLTKAVAVAALPNEVAIYQERAHSDMMRRTRSNRSRYHIGHERLRRWCHSLAQAVACLHLEGIIHGDIKAQNVLLYSSGSVRLTDFTLSVIKTDIPLTHTICTCTHRPLEVFQHQSWSESVDIWSLGCTFYEIAFGTSLFPYQRFYPTDTKREINERSINSLLAWYHNFNYPTPLAPLPINYLRPRLSNQFYQDSLLADLILNMLKPNPADRLTSTQVLGHPYFSGLSCRSYNLTTKEPIITSPEVLLSLLIERCSCLDDPLVPSACNLISRKLFRLPIEDIISSSLLLAERRVCSYLGFRLHR